jgi:hypothetical protein
MELRECRYCLVRITAAYSGSPDFISELESKTLVFPLALRVTGTDLSASTAVFPFQYYSSTAP